MNDFFSRLTSPLARIAAALVAAAGIASCGGGVSTPTSPVVNSPTLTILPDTAVMYSGMPTTFILSGGTGTYILSSSNQAILPFAGGVTGRSVTLVPNPVSSDTVVTLTLRDNGTAPPVTATVTVRPGTVNNAISIIPTSTISGCAAPALCSGGDALVVVTLSQGGIPLPARGVRFDAESGDFRFIVSVSGSNQELLDTSRTTVTDETGKAVARIRVLPLAPNQSAILKVTDLGTGAFQRTTFPIAQVTAGGGSFYALPTSVTFTGSRVDQCARGVSSRFFVFGGVPPYSIGNSTGEAFSVSPQVVGLSGGSFSVTAQGTCVGAGTPLTITDSTGRTISVTVANELGTQAVPELVVAPATLTLDDCNSVASFTVAGGTGAYLQPSSGSGSIVATLSGNTVSVRRLNPSPPSSSPASIAISDGVSVQSVSVTLRGAALGACPTTGLSASPASVTLSDCSSSTQVAISGGSGTYTVVSSSSSVSASVAGNIVTIRRADPSVAFSGGVVTISDGSSTFDVAVVGSGAGAGICPTPTTPTVLTASPSSLTLTDCNSTPTVTLSGGSGTYTALASSATITATVNGNLLTIRRTNPSGAFPGGAVTISDGTSTTSVTVNASGNGAGVCPTPTTPVALTASPASVTLSDCSSTPSVLLAGGSGTYSALSNTTNIQATLTGNVLVIRRANPSAATAGGSVTVTDGTSTVSVSVSATGNGAGTCPTPTLPAALAVSPASVNLSDCGSTPSVLISGGAGSYSTVASNTSIQANLNGNLMTIRRASPSTSSTGGTITVSDGSSTTDVTVTVSGPGAGSCPAAASPITASATSVTLSTCTAGQSVTLGGGTGAYTVSSNSTSIAAVVNGTALTIQRSNPSPGVAAGTVTVSDGTSNLAILVNTTGSGASTCPTQGTATALAASPSNTVDLPDCLTTRNVILSGGTGSYRVFSNHASISAVLAAGTTNVVRISRVGGSAGFSSPQSASVFDSDPSPLNFSPLNLIINTSGTGGGGC